MNNDKRDKLKLAWLQERGTNPFLSYSEFLEDVIIAKSHLPRVQWDVINDALFSRDMEKCNIALAEVSRVRLGGQ